MENIYLSGNLISIFKNLFIAAFFLMAFQTSAQLTGIKNIPGDYATIVAAVTDLNAQGVGAGGVTFNVAGGHTETIASPISVTATGTAANPIIFQKGSEGANPLITSYTGGTASPNTTASPLDGIFNLVGSDYVTIDGIDLLENASNTGTALMEYGYAFFKASVTDGCQNNIIRNCTITLNRNNVTGGTAESADGSCAIWAANTLSTNNAVVTITDAAGSHSNNSFHSNTIQNCQTGIYLRGFNATSPYTLYDQNNDIGGADMSTGNIIVNYGGGTGATTGAQAIRAIYQNNFNFSYNSINSNDGGGINHPSTIRGIFMSTGTSSSGDIIGNTVTLHGGGTTSLMTAIENNAGSTAASNTINISENVVENCTYTTATSAAFTGIDNGGTAANINVNNNTVNNNTLGTAGTGTSGVYTGISVSGATASMLSASNNTVTGNIKNGTSGNMYCLRIGSGQALVDGNFISDNTFNSTSGATSANLHGIQNSLGSGNSEDYVNNTIYNLMLTGANTSSTNTINGILTTSSSSSAKNINNNNIYNLTFSNTATGSCTVTGINHTTASTVNIFRNKIYDLTASNGASSVVIGITHGTTTTTCNVYNNLIGNLFNLQANIADAVKGINVTNATANANNNVSYNTVFINATSTGTNFGTTGIFHTTNATATTGTLNLRNNIIVNTSTPNGTGVTTAYRRSSTTLTNYGSVSNYNLFYGGTPGAANLIFYDGTNADQTIAAFKARVSPRDANSVTENPPFLSTTGSNANFLHINTGIATQIESGAVNITGITDDYDTNIRQGNTGYAGSGTAPDIGADEGEFTGADLSAPTISYTALSFTCSTGDRALNGVTISDASGVPTSGSLQPRIYYKKGAGGAWFSSQGVLSTGNGLSGTWNFTIIAADMGGLASGDVVYYYVIAQDVVSPANITSNPSAGLVATDVNTVTTHPTSPNNYPISNTISGTFMVGTGQTYTTLTAAINLYNTSCLSGPVVFELLDASYSGSETFPIVINTNPDASSTNTLTIRPAAATAVSISGTSGATASALIRLDGADYVTIDGLNTGGASLNIENTSTTSGTAVIWLSSKGAGMGASNNTIKNASIKAGVAQNASTTVTYGIVIAGSTLSGTITSVTAGDDNDNNTIDGNMITKVRHAIYLRGGGTTNPNSGTMVINNTIGPSAFGVDEIGKGGIIVREEDGIQIKDNEIRFIGGDYSNTSSGSDRVGIAFGTDASWTPTSVYVKNAVVTNNSIHDIVDERTFSAVGIALGGADGANATNNWVANNMLFNIKANGTSSDQTIGIGLNAGNGDMVVYNSIHLTGDTDPNASASSPTISNYGISISSTSVTNPVIKDNIVFMDLTSSSASGLENACINVPASYSWGTGSSNYNDLYINMANAQSFTGCVGGDGGTYHLTLANWQTAVSQDANSVAVEPVFISASDLHLNTSSNIGINNMGTPISGITTDFDGDTRDVTNPDMGIDEFTPPVGLDVGITGLVSPASSGCYTSAEMVTVILKNHGAGTIDFSVNNVVVTATGTGGYNSMITVNSGTLASNATMNVTLPMTIDMSANGTYTFNANTTLGPDINMSNDAMSPADRIVFNISGTYPVGTGQSGFGGFETLTDAITAYNGATCMPADVLLSLTDASYGASETFPILINPNTAPVINTLTIKPAVPASITGSNSGAIIRINGADKVKIDGSTGSTVNSVCPLMTASRDLTITNTNTGTSSAVIWLQSDGANGAQNNTIMNCNLVGNSNTTTLFGLGSGSSTISTSSIGTDNDNNSFVNNKITKTQNGIYSRGASAANKNTGTVINQNILNQPSPNNIGRTGIWVGHEDMITISGNGVGNFTHASDLFGISLGISNSFSNATTAGNEVTNATITQNVIDIITNTGTNSAAGIMVASAASGTNLIANNMISGVSANGTASDFCTGILLGGGTGSTTNVYYNSVAMNGTIQGATAGATQSFALAVTNTTAPTLDIRNNILVNTQLPNASGTTKFYAIGLAYSSTMGNYAGLTSDYNDLFASSGANYHVGITGGLSSGTARTTLADWQTETGKDAMSENIEPVFMSSADLHIDIGNLTNTPLDEGAIGIAGVTIDIDCETRMTDIGADEFEFVNCDGAIGGTASGSATFCGSGTPTITASGYSLGVGSTYQWQSSSDAVFTNPVDIPGQTTPSVLTTGVVNTTTYYRLKVTCPTGNMLDYSTVVTVTVNSIPTASATSNSPICAGQTLNLMGATDVGVSYTWSGPNSFNSTSQNPSIANATVAASGVYTFTTTSAQGCTSSASMTSVVVNATPTAVTITPTAVSRCSGDPASLLTASGGLVPTTVAPVVNSGTTALSGDPYRTFWDGSRLQFIYSAAELMAAGLSANSQISAIAFDVTSANDPIMNLNISLGHTASVTFGSTSMLTGLTSVFSGPHSPFVGVNTHNFSTPFVWNGTDNIVFEACFSANNSSSSSTVKAVASVTNTVNHNAADATTCSTGTGTLAAIRPYIILTYLVPSTYTWTPNGPGSGLYTDAGAMMEYNGTPTPTVYALPSVTTTYTATATSGAGCTNSNTVEVYVNSLIVQNTNNSGGGSLRDVINCAPDGSTITFAPGLSGQMILLTSGEISINKNLTIMGLGALNLSISGNNSSRIFHVQSGFDLTLEDLTLKDASAMSNGGAFWCEGDVFLDNVVIDNCKENGQPKGFTAAAGSNININGNCSIND